MYESICCGPLMHALWASLGSSGPPPTSSKRSPHHRPENAHSTHLSDPRDDVSVQRWGERAVAAVAVVLAALLAGSAQAHHVVADRAELCQRSQLVVVAEVTGAEVRWVPGPAGQLETRVWLAPERALRGRAPEGLEVALPGGARGALRFATDDAAQLDPDHRYLLFLRWRGGAWRLVAGASGAVPLEGGTAGARGEHLGDALLGLGSCGAQ